MIQKSIILLSFLALLQACANEPAGEKTAAASDVTASQPAATATDAIKADAIDESDHLGRVRATAKKLQKEFDYTQGKMPGQGKMTASIDDDFNLIIQNEVEGSVFKTVVNLNNLNPEDGGMMLLPDVKPGEYPGLRILVLDGKPGVITFKNGERQKEERQLDIYMPQRNNIENIAPVLSSILNVVHGKVE